MKTIIVYDFDDAQNAQMVQLKSENSTLKAELNNARARAFGLETDLAAAQSSIAILQSQLRFERERNKKAKKLYDSVENGEAMVLDTKDCVASFSVSELA